MAPPSSSSSRGAPRRPSGRRPASGAATTKASSIGSRRPSGREGTRRPSRLTIGLVAVTALLLVAVGVRVVQTQAQADATPTINGSCTTLPGRDGAVFTLDLDQAANATTIAAVGKRLGMPNHAVTVALATALQESQLHNLTYGDRDSLGLFQQRPSQGWGTEEQVQNATYASEAFYAHLKKVPKWETLPVTDAAQAVQYSAAPKAYAQWEPEARELAIALTGEIPAGFACRVTPRPEGVTPSPDIAAATLEAELGAPGMERPVSPARGWTIASWLVGHAVEHHLTTVSFAGQTWTRDSGAWTPDPTAPTDRVTAL